MSGPGYQLNWRATSGQALNGPVSAGQPIDRKYSPGKATEVGLGNARGEKTGPVLGVVRRFDVRLPGTADLTGPVRWKDN